MRGLVFLGSRFGSRVGVDRVLLRFVLASFNCAAGFMSLGIRIYIYIVECLPTFVDSSC